MPRGGARPNAGRKAGSQNKVTREAAQRTREVLAVVQNAGVTPLEVMLSAMRNAWAANDVDKATAYARDAAPYMHPRLQSSTVKLHDKRSVADLDTAELIATLQQEGDPDGTPPAQNGNGTADQVH